MTDIPYEERVKTYTNALISFGEENQIFVAIEELSECQKELCKFLRGIGNADNLAEEMADAVIMLEQMRMIFGLDDMVENWMDRKIRKLDDSLRKTAGVELPDG